MSRYLYIIALAVSLLFGSCAYDELCTDHPHWPTLEVSVDLSDTGYESSDVAMSSYMMRCYAIDDGIMPLEDLYATYEYRMQSWADYYVQLPKYSYKTLIYSDYIMSQLRFYNTDDYDNIYVEGYSSSIVTESYSKDSGLLYTAEPPKTVTGHFDQIDVSENGASIDGGSVTTKLEFKAKRITQTITIDIYITNTSSISYLEGNVGEVNGRYYLTQERANSGGCCLKFNNMDDNMELQNESFQSTEYGKIYCYTLTVNTFGFTQKAEGPTIYETPTFEPEVEPFSKSDVDAGIEDTVAGDLSEEDVFVPETGVEYNNPESAIIYFDILLKCDEGYRYAEIDVTEQVRTIKWGDNYELVIAKDSLGSCSNPIILPEIIDDSESNDSGFDIEVGGFEEKELEVGAGEFEVVTSN